MPIEDLVGLCQGGLELWGCSG